VLYDDVSCVSPQKGARFCVCGLCGCRHTQKAVVWVWRCVDVKIVGRHRSPVCCWVRVVGLCPLPGHVCHVNVTRAAPWVHRQMAGALLGSCCHAKAGACADPAVIRWCSLHASLPLGARGVGGNMCA
jgi:hypothetical protein